VQAIDHPVEENLAGGGGLGTPGQRFLERKKGKGLLSKHPLKLVKRTAPKGRNYQVGIILLLIFP
jgi:hypothetical protein